MKLLSSPMLFAALLLFTGISPAQTVRVDISPDKAVPFDPDLALGTSLDILPAKQFEKVFRPETIKESLSAGWGPITYRQNTELSIAAWHWNPNGSWSDPASKSGYFIGNPEPAGTLRASHGYPLPHRGNTRNGGTSHGYSRLTDDNSLSYWKSNPYLAARFTTESDSLHPQWIVIDFGTPQPIDALQIAWANPYATRFTVQYWVGSDDAMNKPVSGKWTSFPQGDFANGQAASPLLRLAPAPIPARFVRIWMTESSNTCDTHGAGDLRNCVGYAASEIFAGNFSSDGQFVDLVKHVAGENQTAVLVSSIDPWHSETDLNSNAVQTGFDLFFTSGYTNHLPAMIPVSMLYGTPDDSAFELAYLRKRGYPISYVEMGEEPDGQYTLPEDYAALYLQWATALHRVDPALKLGGPSFEGVNKDIEVWPDANGKVSWTARFIDYLKQHGRMNDLAFFSFEHYPYDPCKTPWGVLYDEPELVNHIMQVWHEDGVPADMPMFITEGNLSSGASETYQDIFAGVWLADYIGSFLNAGGKGVYFFHYLPLQMEPGCNSSPGTFGMFTVDGNYRIQQQLAQFFVAQLINLEWVQRNGGEHQVFAAKSDVQDGAGHDLVTAYAVKRPDGKWSVMAVNRDQQNAHKIRIAFDRAGDKNAFAGPVEISIFGSAQYQWHPAQTRFMAHAENSGERTIVATTRGAAEPDGPIAHTKVNGEKD